MQSIEGLSKSVRTENVLKSKDFLWGRNDVREIVFVDVKRADKSIISTHLSPFSVGNSLGVEDTNCWRGEKISGRLIKEHFT